MIVLTALQFTQSQGISAVFYWDPNGDTTHDAGAGGVFWDTSSAQWNSSATPGSGTTGAWNSSPTNTDTAIFDNQGLGAAGWISLGTDLSAGALVFKSNTGLDFDGSNIISYGNTLKLTGSSITLGASNNSSPVTATIATALAGSNGIVLTSAGLNSNQGGKLVLANTSTSLPNTLTGGITIGNNTTLSAVVTSTDSSIAGYGSNPLGTNNVTLQNGGTLEINASSNVGSGLSVRTFNIASSPTGDTSRIDFTKLATGVTLPNSSSGSPFTVTGNSLSNEAFSSYTRSAGLDGNGSFTSIQYLDDSSTTTTATNYAVQYVGKLKVGTSGAYSFYTSSDDGSRVFIDGVLILNNDGGKGSIDLKSAPIPLTAGYHDIRIDYVQGTGGAAENLGWSSTTPGADVGPTRTVISGATNLYLAESNSATGASNAIKLGNNIQVTGNSAINLLADRNLYTQVELGGLTLNSGKTITVTSLDSAGSSVDSNGFVYGAGKTVRFAGSSVFGNGAGTVTLNSIPNVTFDGVVSDGGNNMNIVWNNSGNLIFSQTAAANALGVGTTLNMTGSSTQSISSSTSVGSSTVILSTVGASPTPAPALGSYVTGTGIPDGTRVIAVTADQRNRNSNDHSHCA